MEPIRQPEGSEICGQCCVAMAAGVGVKRAIDAVGKDGATRTRDIIRGLRALGLNCADRMRRTAQNRALPPRCIVHICWRRRYGHWMLYWDGHVYDPGGAYPDGYDSHSRIVSYLEILDEV